ncbi:hypothetical protein [Subtercola sp. RTI3]|uniref:hypothetical protein n=1 Tax=Subtercola sp. RTI3 TaxID=3048639 RepID=UPI002B2338BD|nr:hypothetical protein [Subtercola sp. RTI3]MEA9984603.1 hypothetical protein [Subtercola sp. RTI3]
MPNTQHSLRNITAAGLVALPLIVILITWLIWRGDLPQTLPTQWSGDEVVSTQPTIIVLIVSGVTALVAAVFAVSRAAIPIASYTSRFGFLVSGLFAALAAVIWMISAGLAVTVSPNIHPAIGSLGLVIIASPLYGLLVLVVARKPVPARRPTRTAPIDLSPTESASWNQTMTTPAFAWAALAALIIAIGIIVLGPVSNHDWDAAVTSSAAAIGVLTLVFAALAWLRVTGDHRGLRISSRVIPFLSRTISLDKMADVQSTEIHPLDWGGWGYRITPGRSAIVLRNGEGIVVYLKSGRGFAVTVDDSDGLAAVLRGLLGKVD